MNFDGCRKLNKLKDEGSDTEFCCLAIELLKSADKADMDFIIAVCDVHITASERDMCNALLAKSASMEDELSFVSRVRINLIKDLQTH